MARYHRKDDEIIELLEGGVYVGQIIEGRRESSTPSALPEISSSAVVTRDDQL